jgi:GH15 family glucan-1,4-alpha-glucosidase
METNNKYKANYKFNKPDPRNYTIKTEYDPISNLEISTFTIPSKNQITILKSLASPNIYTLPNFNTQSNILNQGDIQDCVSNAFAYAIKYQTKNHFVLSRLYLYDICRILDNEPLNTDPGTSILTACKSIQKYGAVPETIMTYPKPTASMQTVFNALSTFASLNVFQTAKLFKKFTYAFIDPSNNYTSSVKETTIKNSLNTNTNPIIFGLKIYDSFYTVNTSTGRVPIPNTTTETYQGGHCLCLVGYDDTTRLFTCVNSWGTGWGKQGIGYIPYDYLTNTNLAFDFCTTTFVY